MRKADYCAMSFIEMGLKNKENNLYLDIFSLNPNYPGVFPKQFIPLKPPKNPTF